MLREVGIKNFVLIEDLRLELDKGLNVLTGETGAGKTIVLDALGLLLGDRFSSESVRQGAERSDVDGVFSAPKSREFQRWREDHGFEKMEEIVIRREGYPDGRSRAFLNDRPVTLGTLQELSVFLVDVHGQNEHQQILKPSVQLACLDRFAGLEDACAAIEPLFRDWQKLSDELNLGQLSEQERLQRVDLYRFQLQEIRQAALQPAEDQDLAARLPELKNAERLRALAETAYSTLYEEEGSALEKLSQAARAFDALKALAPSVEPLLVELQESKDRLEETARGLKTLAKRWETDPAALEEAMSRQDLIARLAKKYGGSVESVLTYAEKLQGDLDRLENTEVYRRELQKQVDRASHDLDKASRDLSAKRKRAARQLSEAVQEQLADLGLKQAVFECKIEVVQGTDGPVFTTTGIDRAAFQWAPNPGEGSQPLKEIISGGEMSRVMLALKTVLAQTDAVPTLVFDEVDAGIGGLTAQAVGRKLRALSRHHQILCVSHLPQIASCAHAHFRVSKRVSKARTYAEIERLEPAERLQELARLLGSQVTPTSVRHAKELLDLNT